MRHPLIPATALVALVILVCEGFFGFFSDLKDPSRSAAHYSHYVANENWMRVQVCEIPSERHKTIKAVCNVLEIKDSNDTYYNCKGKILLYFQKPSNVAFGDELIVLTSPHLPGTAENPYQFDYRRYLRHKGILYTDYIPSYNYKILCHNTTGWKYRIVSLRQRLINVIRFSQLTPSQQGIAEAFILGYDEDLSPTTENNFRSAGITHLLCVSGLHVGIVAMLVGWCLFFLSNRRPTRILKGCIQIVVIWTFAILTGMAPATMRAALMFSFIVVGQMFFTRPPTLNAIAASALVLLVCNPLLLFDVGFQLSYSAVFGIVLLTRPLERLIPLPDNNNLLTKLLRKIRTLFCLSLVAQLSTMPLTLYYFHQFPPYFLIANMTIIPCATLLLGSIMLMLAVCWWPFLFKLAGSLVAALLSATESITSAIASLPNAMIDGIYFDKTMLIITFAVIVFVGWALICRQWGKMALALTFAIILTVYARITEAKCSSQRQFDIYNIRNHTAVEFFVGHKSYLVCDSNLAANSNSIDFQTKNNIIHHQIKQRTVLPLDTNYEDDNIIITNYLISFNDQTYRIVNHSLATMD